MISIIIPFYNEAENLPELVERLHIELKKVKQSSEIVLIDDGSTDDGGTFIQGRDIILKTHRKKFGKGKALQTGVQASKGDIVVFMDADLQNDPIDLEKFLIKLDAGYDLVNGYRKARNDGTDKTLPSKVYNKLIRWLFALELHDINCGFKAMKREVIESISLYGDNYRILPILAKNEGFKITEIEVVHHPRKHGVSKYGAMRVLYGFFDVISHFFLLKFVEKPIHFFGSIGSVLFGIGGVILLYLGIERIFFSHMLYRRPVLFVGILLVIVGVQIVATGFIGELIVYLNNRTKNKK